MGLRSNSLIATEATHTEAEMAIRCRITTGTTTIASIPSASVTIPLMVGTNSSAKAATIAFSLSQFHLWYSS